MVWSLMEELRGSILRFIYQNKENGYAVARYKPDSHLSDIIIVGNLFHVYPGDTLVATGVWINHPTFGEQFKVSTYQIIPPQTTEGIKKYLASGLLKGIGPKTAERIVARFGEETLDILDNDPERLLEIKLLTKKKVAGIRKYWESQRAIKDIMLFLQTYNVSTAYATRIYRQYKSNTVEILRQNPFRLAEDIFGIGFKTADRIAGSLGFSRDAPARLLAGVRYVLNRAADQGNVYLPEDILIENTVATLEVEPTGLEDILRQLVTEKKLIREEDRYYLPYFHNWEVGIAGEVERLLNGSASLKLVDIDHFIRKIEQEHKINFAEAQKTAISRALKEKMMILTGGPGTGKTTIVRAIIDLIDQLGGVVKLAAPTGRAARKLAETTGQEAITIHRLLKFEPGSGRFQHDRSYPLENGVYIIDEASMIDTFLMFSLMSALPTLSYLILVGDEDQLPAVGAGNVLGDMLKCELISQTRLTKIFRQAETSLIVTNAHKINQGKMITLKNDKDGDLFFIDEDSPPQITAQIVNLVKSRLPKTYQLNPFVDIQVLSPSYRGETGVENLNNRLQSALNSGGREYEILFKKFHLGDKVMQTKNNYDKEVYNGDIGILKAVDPERKRFYVDYIDRVVEYEYPEVAEIVLAYAITIHKSQGSEYPAIVIPFSTQHFIMLQRNLLYTAITRASRLVVIVGSKKALAIAIKNDKPTRRFTTLTKRLNAMKVLDA